MPGILLAGTLLLANASVRATDDAEICIYGGTSAGVIAAVEAARMGKSVVLLEPGGHLGGMSTEGLGGSDIDNKGFQNSPAVGGLALEFYRRISRHYGREAAFEDMLRTRRKDTNLWRFEPKVAEKVFTAWLQEYQVRVFLYHRLADDQPVEKQDARLRAIRCDNGALVRASVFVDATYEGDLLAAAGISTIVGREGSSRYGEEKNGVQLSASYRALDRRIDPYRRVGEPGSGLIFSVQDEPLGHEGESNETVQAFCFRLCLTDDPRNRVPIPKPDDYDPDRYEVQRRYLAAGGVITLPTYSLPNRKCDPGSWHKLAGNMPGMNQGFVSASSTARQEIMVAARNYIQGLYWFLANDGAVPPGVRTQWAKWGLCRDEFTDNQGWPRAFYLRNGRRMISDFVLTYAHGRGTNPEPVSDPVGLVWWPHDLHEARRVVRDGAVWHEGTVFSQEGEWRPFGIPYRALAPRKTECVNLLTPTCPSSSYVAYGAYRIEFQFMAAGHAVAAAAALSIDDRVPVQDVSYARLRERLLADGQVLTAPFE